MKEFFEKKWVEGKNFFSKMDIRYKTVFLCTVITGVLAHGMALFNKYSVHDDAGMYYGVGTTFASGRWMLEFLGRLELKFFGDGHYTLPVVNGFASVFFIACAACVIVSLLDIRGRLNAAFVGGLIVAFPVIAGLFGFMFTAHFYMFAFLISIAGAWLICKGRSWYSWIAGTVFIACGAGVYQAYMPLTFSVILIYCIKYLFENDELCRDKVKTVIKNGFLSFCALAGYLVINKICLVVFQVELTDYQGISSMGKSSAGEYIRRIIYAYKEFFFPADYAESYMYFYRLRHMYYLSLVIVFILLLMKMRKLWRQDKICFVCEICLIGLFPLATNLIFVFAGQSNIHALMVMGAAAPFVLMAVLLDEIRTSKSWIPVVSGVFLCCILLMYVRYDNRCYLKADFAQKECVSYFTTLITQIKSADGYRDELPVVYINEYEKKDLTVGGVDKLKDIRIVPYSNLENNFINDYNWKSFMNIWCGFNPKTVGEDKYKKLPEVRKMPSYPDDGSIKVIDGVVVVKF